MSPSTLTLEMSYVGTTVFQGDKRVMSILLAIESLKQRIYVYIPKGEEKERRLNFTVVSLTDSEPQRITSPICTLTQKQANVLRLHAVIVSSVQPKSFNDASIADLKLRDRDLLFLDPQPSNISSPPQPVIEKLPIAMPLFPNFLAGNRYQLKLINDGSSLKTEFIPVDCEKIPNFHYELVFFSQLTSATTLELEAHLQKIQKKLTTAIQQLEDLSLSKACLKEVRTLMDEKCLLSKRIVFLNAMLKLRQSESDVSC